MNFEKSSAFGKIGFNPRAVGWAEVLVRCFTIRQFIFTTFTSQHWRNRVRTDGQSIANRKIIVFRSQREIFVRQCDGNQWIRTRRYCCAILNHSTWFISRDTKSVFLLNTFPNCALLVCKGKSGLVMKPDNWSWMLQSLTINGTRQSTEMPLKSHFDPKSMFSDVASVTERRNVRR